ncbi:hypothetical protein D9M69_651090 [compost metagenome]
MHDVMPGRVDTTLVSSEQRMKVPRVSVKSALAKTSTAPRFTAENSSSNSGFFLPFSDAATRLFSLAIRRCIKSSLTGAAPSPIGMAGGIGGTSALATTSTAGAGGGNLSKGFSGTVTSS